MKSIIRSIKIYKKQIRNYTIMVIVSAILGYGALIVYENHDNKEVKIDETKIAIEPSYKEAKFTPEEMYKFIEEGSWPGIYTEDIKEIAINWYDYYSKDTPFRTCFGEEINYDMYQKFHNKYYTPNGDNETYYHLVLMSNKEWFENMGKA